MKQFIRQALKIFLVFLSAFFVVTIEADTYDVDVSLTATFDDGVTSQSNMLVNMTFQQTFMLDQAFDEGDYTYVYVSMNGFIEEIPLSALYTIYSKTEIELLFAPSDKHLVVFASQAGQILKMMYVSDAYELLESDVPDIPDIPHYVEVTTNVSRGEYAFLSSDGMNYLSPITKHTIFYAQYALDYESI